jgi:hypothetical protein
VLAPKPLLASLGSIASSEEKFLGAYISHDVMLAGTRRPSLWSSAANDEEEEELAPQTLRDASKAISSCKMSVVREVEVAGGWYEVLLWCGSAPPAPASLPIPFWHSSMVVVADASLLVTTR